MPEVPNPARAALFHRRAAALYSPHYENPSDIAASLSLSLSRRNEWHYPNRYFFHGLSLQRFNSPRPLITSASSGSPLFVPRAVALFFFSLVDCAARRTSRGGKEEIHTGSPGGNVNHALGPFFGRLRWIFIAGGGEEEVREVRELVVYVKTAEEVRGFIEGEGMRFEGDWR